VRKFQESAELKATGVLDDRTVKAIKQPEGATGRSTPVLVNMERWRWLPRQLGAGLARQRLGHPQHPRLHAQGDAERRQVWNTRVVTGKPGQHATPLLTETMKFSTVNPTWKGAAVDHLQ